MRILIISHDVVGRRMAGPGIRAWHMARVLASHGTTTLVAPQPIDLSTPGFVAGDYTWGQAASLARWRSAADVVVANGFVLAAHPELASIPQPLALDLYDPVLLENLEQMRTAAPDARISQASADRQLLARQLAAGDFFLCATERQRDLYLGALMLAGRLTPALTDADLLARALIDVAPFGLDPTPPQQQAPALRGVLPGIGNTDPLLLWTGGLWDWLDPLTLIAALPAVRTHHPNVRLVFLAGRHPGNVPDMRVPNEARALAEAHGLLNTHVFFYEEWVPYERRADFLLEATLAVSLHRNHLETAYAAVRSRFLDHLWVGMPSLVSDGDAAAALVRAHSLGAVVPPGNSEATAEALTGLLGDAGYRAECAAHARALAPEFAWERVLAPLVQFCLHPARTRPAQPKNGLVLQRRERLNEQQRDLIRQLETSWRLDAPAAPGPRGLAQQLLRRLLAPVFAQQRAFNAAALKLVYTLSKPPEPSDTEHNQA